MTNQYDIGFDAGNSETSIVIIDPNSDQRTLTMPSYLSRGSAEALMRFRSMSERTQVAYPWEVLQPNEYILNYPMSGNHSTTLESLL